MPTTPINLVSLSSEQLWPTIHCLAYYGPRIQRLFLLHTNDELKSIAPARSIAKFASLWNPKISVVFPSDIIENSSTGVSKILNGWLNEFPRCEWVINASGGTKLMLLGVLDFANLQNVEVIYRDLTGKPGEIWQSVRRDEDFRFLKNTPLPINETATDLIPVEMLVKTIWSDNDNFQIEFGKKIPGLDVLKIAQYASQNDWNFKIAFQKCGYPSTSSSGQLFEQFMVGILIQLGISNVTCNAVRNSPSKSALSEIDIIANHQGNLTVVDCKLRSLRNENEGNVDSLFDQIRKTYQLGNELGGLGAKVILLRPNRTLSENEHQLAKSYRITVLDAPTMPNLIDHFAKHFKVQHTPENLLKVQTIIREKQRDQNYVGVGSAPFKHDWEQETRNTGILNVTSLLDKLRNDLGHDWSAFEFDSKIYLNFPIPKNSCDLSEDDLEDVLHNKIQSKFGHLCFVEILKIAKKTALCELRSFPGKIGELQNEIRKNCGKHLL